MGVVNTRSNTGSRRRRLFHLYVTTPAVVAWLLNVIADIWYRNRSVNRLQGRCTHGATATLCGSCTLHALSTLRRLDIVYIIVWYKYKVARSYKTFAVDMGFVGCRFTDARLKPCNFSKFRLQDRGN